MLNVNEQCTFSGEMVSVLEERIRHLPLDMQQNVMSFWRAQTSLHTVGPYELQLDNSRRTYGGEVARRLYVHSMGNIMSDLPSNEIMYPELRHVKNAFKNNKTPRPSKEELKKAEDLLNDLPFDRK